MIHSKSLNKIGYLIKEDKMKNKKKVLGVYIKTDILEKLRAEAKRNRRSTSAEAELRLEYSLKNKEKNL